MLDHLKAHLKEGSWVLLGIGNTLRSDDGAGSLLAARLKGKLSRRIYDCGSSPENYLGKIIQDNPRTVVLADAVDFGGAPGEIREIEAEGMRSSNLFSTHNSSLELVVNYLKGHISADIIVLAVQPKRLEFDDKLSPEVEKALVSLEEWFDETEG